MSKYSIDTLSKFKDVNKSTIFLYTLLQIKSNAVPAGTYMGVNGCSIFKDMNLICLFHVGQEDFYEVDKELIAHSQFDVKVEDSDGFCYYVMDFSTLPAIYNAVKKGRYSKLSINAKTAITFTDHPLGLIGVSPELYYDEFSEKLNISVEQLKRKGELLEPPNQENETLNLSKDMQERFKD